MLVYRLSPVTQHLPGRTPLRPGRGSCPTRWHSRRCWTGPGRAPWSRGGGPRRRGRACRGWGRHRLRSRRLWREISRHFQVLEKIELNLLFWDIFWDARSRISSVMAADSLLYCSVSRDISRVLSDSQLQTGLVTINQETDNFNIEEREIFLRNIVAV